VFIVTPVVSAELPVIVAFGMDVADNFVDDGGDVRDGAGEGNVFEVLHGAIYFPCD